MRHSPSAEERTHTFRFGEFTFDCGSRQLLRDGNRRHLSPKAQQLLRMLLLARPRALSRAELYDALWPSTFVCETNLASVVNEIRRALADDARTAQYIRTVHGFGYAFCGEVASAAPTRSTFASLLFDERGHPLSEGQNSIGRSPDCRVVMTHSTISRRHAVITILDDVISIHDLDSKNGTYVDGERIGSTPVMVTSKSLLVFGSVGASIAFQKVSSTASLQVNQTELKRAVAERMART